LKKNDSNNNQNAIQLPKTKAKNKRNEKESKTKKKKKRRRRVRFVEMETTPSSVRIIQTVNAIHAIPNTVGTKKFDIRSAKRYKPKEKLTNKSSISKSIKRKDF
jgi:hypothetical protein